MEGNSRLNLFTISLPLIAVIAIAGFIAPQQLADAARRFTSVSFSYLDWFFMLVTTGMLVLGLWLALSRFGSIRLGEEGARPEFSNLSWFSMLFAAGMGTGIMFWGVAEPLTHFQGAPGIDPGTEAAARQAMVITAMHWGLHAWAIYAVAGLVLAYFCFRRDAHYLPGAPIRHGFRGRWVEPVALVSDLLAILAIAFGVAAAMTMGTLQIQSGLHIVFGWSADSNWIAAAILLCLVAAYTASAATSLEKGIQLLSNLNIFIAVVLGIVLFVLGPSIYVLKVYAWTLKDYVAALPQLSVEILSEDADTKWLHGWTLTYFVWWIAWAPFVGIFIARISRGRTIREFVLGVIFVPTLFSLFWFAIFGGTGLYEELYGAGGVADAVAQGPTTGLFALFALFPWSDVLSIVAIVLVFIFMVTSVDSATFVLGMLTSGGAMDPPRNRKLAWGIAMGVLGGTLTLTRNIDVIKAIAIVGAIPFTFAMVLQIVAFLRCLLQDHPKGE